MIKKKFKVKISRYDGNRYAVYYAHYYFIPNWKSIKFFFHQGFDSGTECWSIDLFSYKEAESLGNRLNSIYDVNAYYKPLEEYANNWCKRRDKELVSNQPYDTKVLNKD